MTTETPTLVTFVLDRSGSMEIVKEQTIAGFNTYVETLRSVDVAFSLITFDSVSVDKVYVRVPINLVAHLTNATYQPRGNTPLVDAAYEAIKGTENYLLTLPAQPKVVIVIQTDGQENASRLHNWDDLKELIGDKTAKGWQFVFMGAGIDAYDQGARMGVSAKNTVSYNLDAHTTSAAFAATASNTAGFASGRLRSTEYTSWQKQSAGDAFDLKSPSKSKEPAPTVKVVK